MHAFCLCHWTVVCVFDRRIYILGVVCCYCRKATCIGNVMVIVIFVRACEIGCMSPVRLVG